MAPLSEKRRSERGIALLEALAVSSMLILLVTGLLLAAYLTFARAWIEYQGEQSLYCLAERRFSCRSRFEARVRHYLPYGKFRVQKLGGNSRQFQVEAMWNFQEIGFSIKKELDLKRSVRNRDLHW